MEPFDRGQFEQEWAGAFEGAEVTPSAGLWDNIDMTLSGQEGAVYKQRFIYMRWVAAAAIILLLVSGAVVYYYYDTTNELKSQLALRESGSESQPGNPDASLPAVTERDEEAVAGSNANSLSIIGEDKEDREDREDREVLIPSGSVTLAGNSKNDIVSDVETDALQQEGTDQSNFNSRLLISELNESLLSGNESYSVEAGENSRLMGFSELSGLELGYSMGYGFTGIKFGEVEMEKQPEIIFEYEEEEIDKKLWAGLNVSGGSFSPEAGGLGLSFGAAEADFAVSPNTVSESSIKGNTRGYGLGVGATVSEKMIIKSGIEYASVTSGTYVGSNPSVVSENSLSATRTNFNNSTSTGNSALAIDTYNFISIPFEAGYYLLDGKFSITLNPGIDSRLFINSNSQRYISGTVDQEVLESNINSLTFWGQFSSDLSYQISDHYHLVVSPGYKIALNSLEKGESVHPALTEVAFSMRYIFK